MTREAHPQTAPKRPYFTSLRSAVELAIKNGNGPHDINLARWAETYCCTTADVATEFDKQLSEASLKPSNQWEVFDGK